MGEADRFWSEFRKSPLGCPILWSNDQTTKKKSSTNFICWSALVVSTIYARFPPFILLECSVRSATMATPWRWSTLPKHMQEINDAFNYLHQDWQSRPKNFPSSLSYTKRFTWNGGGFLRSKKPASMCCRGSGNCDLLFDIVCCFLC